MGLFEFLFDDIDKELINELANLDEFGIDEFEDIDNPEIRKEKLANYEYFTENYEEEE